MTMIVACLLTLLMLEGALGLLLLRRIAHALASHPGQGRRLRSEVPGDGGPGDRLMSNLRLFQGERFSVPMAGRTART